VSGRGRARAAPGSCEPASGRRPSLAYLQASSQLRLVAAPMLAADTPTGAATAAAGAWAGAGKGKGQWRSLASAAARAAATLVPPQRSACRHALHPPTVQHRCRQQLGAPAEAVARRERDQAAGERAQQRAADHEPGLEGGEVVPWGVGEGIGGGGEGEVEHAASWGAGCGGRSPGAGRRRSWTTPAAARLQPSLRDSLTPRAPRTSPRR
jgi:hypothetical protein